MEWYLSYYGWDYTFPHSWPGQAINTKHTNKHNTARKARFKARHKG